MKKIIIENKQEIIDFYLKNLKISKCSKKFGLSDSVIKNFLISEKVFIYKDQLNEEELIKFYKKGNCQLKCIKKFKCSSKNIKEILKKNNIIPRNKSTANRIYFCNDDYFEKIDTKDKAYFLGLLISDGWNRNNGFGISLLENDKHILESFKQYTEYTGNLLTYINKSVKQNRMYSLIITSKKLSKDLSKLGCIPAKSHHTYFPDIPEEFHSHFIRGVFDGDGCISLNKKNTLIFNILGNFTLIDEIQKIMIKNCSLSKTKLKQYKKINKNMFYLAYGGNIQAKRIYNWLYKDCDDLYLIRKKEKFDKTFKITVKEKIERHCKICNKKHYAKELCQYHYIKSLKNEKL